MKRLLADLSAGFAHIQTASLEDLEVSAVEGLPWSISAELARALAVSNDLLADWLNVSESEVGVGADGERGMAPSQGFMVLFLARLVGTVETTLSHAGIPNGATPATWLSQWLQSPNEGFQGRMPSEFLCTPTRRGVLVDVLDRDCEEQRREYREHEKLGSPHLLGDRIARVTPRNALATDQTVGAVPFPRVPADFPRGGEGAVSGAQPKLVCRRVGDRFIEGPTAEELADRYAACGDLVTALVEYVERKQRELVDMDRPSLLRKVRNAALAKGLDFSPAELDWVLAKVDAQLGGSP